MPNDSKLALVFDSDSSNPSRVQERIDFVKESISLEIPKDKFDIFCFAPSIDAAIPHGVELAKLKRVARTEYNNKIKSAIFHNIDYIREIPVVEELLSFLR